MILGIDIGVTGALALLSDDGADLIGVEDMPTLLDGPAKRRTVNAPLLATIIQLLGWRGNEHRSGALFHSDSRSVNHRGSNIEAITRLPDAADSAM